MTFERHDQWLAVIQARYLANMVDNYLSLNSEVLDNVTDEKSLVQFMSIMFEAYNIRLYWDPENPATFEPEEGEDDMYVYCHDMVERFLLSLAFDICEEEGDAVGLRALRRTMVAYFCAKKPEKLDSKYAAFTVLDLVVEMVASERTRMRMDLYVTLNPSGTPGGGLFRDKFCEICIRAVKTCVRNTHGGLDTVRLEKAIGALSVMSELQQHDRSSVLRGKLGKEHSRDLVGETARELVEENVAKLNPFNKQRKTKYVFQDKSKGSPFGGFTVAGAERFMSKKKGESISKY